MAKEKRLKGPYWTRNWIEAMWRFTNENFVDFDSGAVDYEALGREEFQFRKALFFRNFKNSERAKVAFDTAAEEYKRPVENGKKGGRPKKSPQDAPHGNAGDDMPDAGNGAAAKTPTSCDQLTADGDTREGSQDMYQAREGGTSESGTSATIYALDGLPDKDRLARAPGTPSKSCGARVPEVPDSEDLYEHVAAEGLDEFDARQWFEMCSDRGWKDRYGNPIGNWKGALKRFCDAKARRRGKEKEG